ncbi:SCO family protein [Poritiphilus flavus]|uniref:SCO family protein n=1 Tax=Poritiphilus flavus TaxID=2697053 RepID=A0A6L9EA66_9FLAO|nr:SCO family protein [Poritiphilus flavus]NAS11665.1 SCO family protein [Poritiphilus flavus]
MRSYSVSLLGILMLLFLARCEEKPKKGSRVASLPYYNDSRFTPRWLEAGSEILKEFHRIPEFDLVNQDGETITQQTFNDKIYVADFIFTTCPGICPRMTANMALLQEAYINDTDVLLLSHSVTPEIDSVPVLKSFAQSKGIQSGKWHLATGDRTQIYDLGRNYYFAEEDLGAVKTANDFLHTENFVLVDKNRHIRGIYNGLNKTSVRQLMADIETLKREN